MSKPGVGHDPRRIDYAACLAVRPTTSAAQWCRVPCSAAVDSPWQCSQSARDALKPKSSRTQRLVCTITEEVAVIIFLAKKTARSKQDRLASRLAAEHGITAKAVRDIWSLRTWWRATEPYWTTDDHARRSDKHGTKGAAPRASRAVTTQSLLASDVAAMDAGEGAHTPPRDLAPPVFTSMSRHAVFPAHFRPADAPPSVAPAGREEGAEDAPGELFPVSAVSDMAQELLSEWATQVPFLVDDGTRGCTASPPSFCDAAAQADVNQEVPDSAACEHSAAPKALSPESCDMPSELSSGGSFDSIDSSASTQPDGTGRPQESTARRDGDAGHKSFCDTLRVDVN